MRISAIASKLYHAAKAATTSTNERQAYDAAAREGKKGLAKFWGLCMRLAHQGRTTWAGDVVATAPVQITKLVKLCWTLCGKSWHSQLNKVSAAPKATTATKKFTPRKRAIGNGPDGWCDLCGSRCYGDCRAN